MTLSGIDVEMVAAVMCVQYMLYVMRVLKSTRLQLEKLVVIEIDNSGLVNNLIVGERTKHVQSRIFFLIDLKEERLLEIV